MSVQTMKRLIAFKFSGIKVSDLNQVSSENIFRHVVSGRTFIVTGPKEIKEIQ